MEANTEKETKNTFQVDFDAIKVGSGGYAYISKQDFYSHPKVQGILKKAKNLKGIIRRK